MEKLIQQIRDAETTAREAQAQAGRGPGGQELSYALTRLREARLFLSDVPVTTPFTEKK